ncbi:MAG: tRNA (adenosine(37)-N6)-threonylcarbamoyltransferase complex dimerization subunit type 1 TsaB [Ferruginibacter sp.]
MNKPVILLIDTSLPSAFIALAAEGEIIHIETNDAPQEHASFVHVAIKKVLHKAGIGIGNIQAVAVNIGPGSYTGLRVGLATAKGICYAANLPLIALNGLELLAHAVINGTSEIYSQKSIIIPMIDARRMEVFMAGYDEKMNLIIQPKAEILDINSFTEVEIFPHIYLTGNGAEKSKELFSFKPYRFVNIPNLYKPMSLMGLVKYKGLYFASLNNLEPFYIKAFHDTNNS